MNRIGLNLCAAALLLAAFAGCQQKDYGHVTGVVKINGQPVEGAVITFAPKEGRSAFAKTAADGSYELEYLPTVKGAMLGENHVTITTYQEPTVDDSGKVVVPGSAERFPPDYNVNTNLVREVKPGENVLDFEVTTTQDSYPRRRES